MTMLVAFKWKTKLFYVSGGLQTIRTKRNHEQGMIAEMKKSASKKETCLSVLRVIVRKGVSVSWINVA